jgi:hypothetical protein
MKILPTQRIYDSLQIEVNKSKPEIFDILHSRMKNTATFTDDNTVIRMVKGESYLFGTGRVGFSFSRGGTGNAILNFDFYTRYPSIIKTLTFFVTIFFSGAFIIILFLVGLENINDVLIFYLKFMLILPVLIALIYLNEKVSRYTTKKYIQHIVRDFGK